eukprot:g40327.t1
MFSQEKHLVISASYTGTDLSFSQRQACMRGCTGWTALRHGRVSIRPGGKSVERYDERRDCWERVADMTSGANVMALAL